ncbi:MAG: hypothetical protein B6U87_03130 [Candidatus Aenigmarchaeota archaeon ex4484_52]|nr:MAG: hypothetical protein B6U87_03130 [Candidatus Aenigmarchaeota archaeon ex4484_52]
MSYFKNIFCFLVLLIKYSITLPILCGSCFMPINLIVNPDYLILKINLWCMGAKQKQEFIELNNIIKKYLIEHKFTLIRK